MINFKEILEIPKISERVITVNGVPVWDYKSIGFDVYLIYRDPWLGVEEEYVTVAEMEQYLLGIGIPSNKATFYTEDSREKLNTWKVSPKLTINFKQDEQ